MATTEKIYPEYLLSPEELVHTALRIKTSLRAQSEKYTSDINMAIQRIVLEVENRFGIRWTWDFVEDLLKTSRGLMGAYIDAAAYVADDKIGSFTHNLVCGLYLDCRAPFSESPAKYHPHQQKNYIAYMTNVREVAKRLEHEVLEFEIPITSLT